MSAIAFTISPPAFFPGSTGRKSFFVQGGTFEQISGSADLFARRFGKNLTNVSPGPGFQAIGGAAVNLERAFGSASGSSTEDQSESTQQASVDVTA